MKIGSILGVSRWTISGRVDEFGLSHLQMFSDISDNDLDNLVRDFMSRHATFAQATFAQRITICKGVVFEHLLTALTHQTQHYVGEH